MFRDGNAPRDRPRGGREEASFHQQPVAKTYWRTWKGPPLPPPPPEVCRRRALAGPMVADHQDCEFWVIKTRPKQDTVFTSRQSYTCMYALGARPMNRPRRWLRPLHVCDGSRSRPMRMTQPPHARVGCGESPGWARRCLCESARFGVRKPASRLSPNACVAAGRPL